MALGMMLLVLLAAAWRLAQGRVGEAVVVGGYAALLLGIYAAGCLTQTRFAWTNGVMTMLTLPWSLSFGLAGELNWRGMTVYNSLRFHFLFYIFFCGGLNSLLLRSAVRAWVRGRRR